MIEAAFLSDGILIARNPITSAAECLSAEIWMDLTLEYSERARNAWWQLTVVPGLRDAIVKLSLLNRARIFEGMATA